MTHLWPLLQAQSVWKTLYTSYIIQKAPQLLATSKGYGKGYTVGAIIYENPFKGIFTAMSLSK